ncbi:MAG TPA: hypothetical protein DCS87_17130 [Rheinheimera sp.]|nr:hypothetical protein [Rheinheimera sp.]
MKPLRLRQLWLAQTAHWSGSFILGLCTLLASVALLAFSGWFISASALAGLTAIWAGNFDFLRPGALIRLLAIVRTTGRYFERLTSHALVLKLLSQLRVDSFKALAQQPFHQVQQGFTGDKLQRLLADIDLLDQFPLQLVNRLGWAVALSLIYSLALAWWLPAALPLILALLAIMLLLPLLAQKYAYQEAGQLVQLQAKRRQHLLQSLTLLTPYLLLNRAGHMQSEQQQQDLRLYQLERQIQRRQLLLQAAMWLLLLLGILLLVLSAVPELQQSQQLAQPLLAAATSTELVAAPTDSSLLNGPLLENLGQAPSLPYQHHAPVLIALLLGWLGLAEVLLPLVFVPAVLGQSRQARDRLNQLCQTASAASGVERLDDSQLQLQLRDVQWGYQHALPVPALTATLNAGSCVLLQGPSGVGKSALLQTIAREIPALAGELRLNNRPISAFTETSLRQACCYVGQRAQVFGLTIAADLRLADPKASDEELQQVLALVGLDSWLARQPQGLFTILGQYGVGLSGGELRRFALARSLLRKAPVLLLDEPFAGLDATTAETLLQNIAAYQRHGILVIASHQQLQSPVFNQHWTLTRFEH